MKKTMMMITAVLLMAGCGGQKTEQQNDAGQTLTGEIRIDGSSTVYPVSEAVAEDFRGIFPKVNVTVGESGTGGGFKKFGRGETDISNASRPIKAGEDSICRANNIEYIELPICYDGLAVVVHTQNNWVDKMTVAELKKLWEPAAQGKIMRWNQIRPEWPNQEIHLFGAGTNSGTFDYFTEAIVGKSKESRGDYTASEDDNVLVQGVASDKLALGFFGLAYYENNRDKLKIIPIDDENEANGAGGIIPNLETVRNGTYQPLSRPLFIYINKASIQRPEMKMFVNYYIEHAQKLAEEVGYVGLPDNIYPLVKNRIEKQVTGSMFAGISDVGVSMEDLLGKMD